MAQSSEALANCESVWSLHLRSCPKRSRKQAAEVLQHKLSLTESEKLVVIDQGGRTILFSKDKEELNSILYKLQVLGCAGSVREVVQVI